MYNENMKQTRFIPTNDCGLQLREPQEGQQESREIEGRPIVFGVRSVNLTPWSSTRKVYEILEPGCISRELLAKSDVILNLNHSNMVPDVLGRFRNSDKDTLSLELRGDGIDCRCDLPKTNNANDALELMKRGDITRHVKKITGLYDVAIVTHPAYEQTNVGLREASEAIDKAIEEQLKRECGDDEAKKKAEEEEAAKRAAEEEAKKKAEQEEAAKREAEAKAKEEQEARELEEQEQRFREQQAMRLRAQHRRREIDIESLNY